LDDPLFGTLNLARAILKQAPDCLLIFAGSGQVYGDTAKSALPLDETALLAPVNEYPTSKAADLALGALCCDGELPRYHTVSEASEQSVPFDNAASAMLKAMSGFANCCPYNGSPPWRNAQRASTAAIAAASSLELQPP
jgi:hypothetical protein